MSTMSQTTLNTMSNHDIHGYYASNARFRRLEGKPFKHWLTVAKNYKRRLSKERTRARRQRRGW